MFVNTYLHQQEVSEYKYLIHQKLSTYSQKTRKDKVTSEDILFRINEIILHTDLNDIKGLIDQVIQQELNIQ